MFSLNFFLFNRKNKKSEPIINENKENYSNKNLTNDKIHVNTTQTPSDQFLLICNSTESSPRDLSSLLPPNKVRKTINCN
jgi:hypothetical protein